MLLTLCISSEAYVHITTILSMQLVILLRYCYFTLTTLLLVEANRNVTNKVIEWVAAQLPTVSEFGIVVIIATPPPPSPGASVCLCLSIVDYCLIIANRITGTFSPLFPGGLSFLAISSSLKVTSFTQALVFIHTTENKKKHI